MADDTLNSGQNKKIHSTVFVSGLERHYSSSGGWLTVGYVNPDGVQVPGEYLVTISSIRNRCSVISILQESIQMNNGSRWEPFIPTAMLDSGNKALQLISLGHRSLITKASSRRMWMGSTPLSLSLTMRFEAVSDAALEVTEACKILQKITSPSDPSNGAGTGVLEIAEAFKNSDVIGLGRALSNTPVLIPPGPTPFTLDGVLNLRSSGNLGGGVGINTTKERLSGGDIIIIEIGKFLTFYNVVINGDVKVTIPPMMTNGGDPISATVSIQFETYEMITTEELDKMYTKGVLNT